MVLPGKLINPRRLVIALYLVFSAAAQTSRHVAITIDDGPVVGEMRDLANFRRISAGLIGSPQRETRPPPPSSSMSASSMCRGSATGGPQFWWTGWTPVSTLLTILTPISV